MICDLFARMNTDQAELASTILYSERRIREREATEKPSEIDVFNYVMEWKKRRRPPLDEREVATAIRNLVMLDVLDLQFSRELPAYDEV